MSGLSQSEQDTHDTGPARGWSGGRGNGRSSHGGVFNSMQANVTAGQMAGMQLNSPGQPYPNQASKQACAPCCLTPCIYCHVLMLWLALHAYSVQCMLALVAGQHCSGTYDCS